MSSRGFVRPELGGLLTLALCLCPTLEGCSNSGNSGDNSPAGSGATGVSGSLNAGGAAGSSAGVAGSGGDAHGGVGNGGQTQGVGGTAGTSGGGMSSAGMSSAGSGGSAATGDRSPDATCARFRADTANLSEGTWSGSVDGCNAGDISADGRENALRLFNLMRWLADLPAVATEEARNQQAQACSLMMTANDMLSHMPPMDWKCYSDLGAKGASTSNISGGPGVASVLSYMVDSGNETTFGHRRIVLSNELGPIGLGSAGKDGSSCMQNIGGTGKAGKAWMAWPPPGPFPMQAYTDAYKRTLDSTGWSLQSKSIDLKAAQVTIMSGGQPKPVKVEQLTGNYGQSTAIRIVPDGWKAAAGASYAVSVSGTATPIAYEIQLIDCK